MNTPRHTAISLKTTIPTLNAITSRITCRFASNIIQPEGCYSLLRNPLLGFSEIWTFRRNDFRAFKINQTAKLTVLVIIR
uniref:Ovule protein n=1 Tax=Panagrellus redivivus TaxID=6233 RepID=A0A7E4VLF1_PANRE